MIAIAFAFSNNRRRINWKLVAAGLVLQFVFAVAVLKVHVVRVVFEWLSRAFVKTIDISHKGTEFLFGNLADQTQEWGYVFAIQVLVNIIFFAALSSLLYYFGVLQWITYGFAWIMMQRSSERVMPAM